MWTAVRAFVTAYGLLLVPIAGALYLAWGFVAEPPPRQLTIAVGQPGGAYWDAALRYREGFAREGIALRLDETAGAVENLDRLRGGQADLALLQGGIATAESAAGIVAIGSVFHEAVWLFRRADIAVDRIGALKGRRIAAGAEGSGTRALAESLLAASGVAAGEATLLPLSGEAAARALAAGEVDAAAFVSARPTPAILALLREPAVALTDFGPRAEAYIAAFPFLSAVRLPAGGASLAEDLPAEEATLIAPSAVLAARGEIHPQIVALLMQVLSDAHRGRGLFSPPGRFPSGLLTDLPVHDDAARWYRDGPSFLQRVAPFWVAVQVERLWVLAIPLLTIAIPLLRFAPPLLRWQIERKIYRWYAELREAEAALAEGTGDRPRLAAGLDRLDAKLARLRVPLAYMQQLYHLRAHLAQVRARATHG
jgi:TRAP transporter TAXI family solute receptor